MLWIVLSAALCGLSSSELCTDNVRRFCGGSTPTACLKDRCSALNSSASDGSFRRQIVDAHNRYRRQAFNGQYATNMLEVSWDDELAENALSWAHQLCVIDDVFGPGHDSCRVTPSYSSVGQNMAWGAGGSWASTTARLADNAVDMWYSENELAFEADLFPFSGRAAIGHYTQLMWATSHKIGCAYVVKTHSLYGKQAWIVCNYAKAGNYLRQHVFERGIQGSNCPSGSQRDPTGLCEVTNESLLRSTLGVQCT